ncbi:MAG: hypothetical protein U9Q15_01610 [Patescibacteria group bacterium]|nr:hypothetical protein [Patescibacteria group bacterium]
MTLIISEKRQDKENFDRLMGRFNLVIRKSGLIRKVRNSRFHPKTMGALTKKRRAIHGAGLRKKREEDRFRQL